MLLFVYHVYHAVQRNGYYHLPPCSGSANSSTLKRCSFLPESFVIACHVTYESSLPLPFMPPLGVADQALGNLVANTGSMPATSAR